MDASQQALGPVCRLAGACARVWPAVLTSGKPGLSIGLSERKVGTVHTPDGTQVTYAGQPLYLYSKEGLALTANGIVTTGSGNGVVRSGGTSSLIDI